VRTWRRRARPAAAAELTQGPPRWEDGRDDAGAASFTEIVHTLANDPSVGLYCVQDHVFRSLPMLVERKVRCGVRRVRAGTGQRR